MNWSHLRATLWLRWRILRNRIRRAGKLSNVLFGVLLFLGLCVCAGFFVAGLTMGLEFYEHDPDLGMVWIGWTAAFLFAWMIGLVTDLQRSDAMSFKHLLHLPVSLGWVFLYNYASSFVSVSIAVFLPGMIGLCVAMVIVQGPSMLLCVPLMFGFFVMVTGLTYQLRGWLARLMEDKRRSRNIVAAITVGFVLLAQMPNLINLGVDRPDREERREQRAELNRLRSAARAEGPEQVAAQAELTRRDEESAEEERSIERSITLATLVIPAGWLPYGVRASSQGRWVPGGLCALGMLAIGAWSLRRSFRTTVLSVVGGGGAAASAGTPRAIASPEREVDPGRRRKDLLVERSLPFTSGGVAGIALANLRSLLRAPEVKLLLLGPLILLGLFGVMLSKGSAKESLGVLAPAMSLGAITMGLVSIFQLIQNMFGMDRGGFRGYVLSPVPREQILLGKNLATAPLAIGTGLIALLMLQMFVPADLPHFLGTCLQLLSAYLILCMVGNLMSILGPMRLKDNGLKAANANLKTVVWQLLSLVLVPLVLSPLALPSVAEFLLGTQAWGGALPWFPLLHAGGLVAVYAVYRWMVRRQGELLQDREQRILDVLTRD